LTSSDQQLVSLPDNCTADTLLFGELAIAAILQQCSRYSVLTWKHMVHEHAQCRCESTWYM